tara:strand:- start:1577 stop:1918 length:342 start_codon:yes stop_codon:yes gene_type:complete
MKNKPKLFLHGECKVIERECLPEGVKVHEVEGEHLIVADSETTGNHHVVETGEGVTFFHGEGNTLFMVNTEPTLIKCVHADRHDNVPIPAGTWEFGTQMEYDYFADELRSVRD